MELQNIKKIVVDSLVSVLDENDIINISVDGNTEIFGSKSIIDSLQLINLIVKIEEDVYERTGEDIIVVQIAGLIARRIVCEISKDQDLKQGNRIGMIRFGSKVDVYFQNYKSLVKINQKTIAGETLIAKR